MRLKVGDTAPDLSFDLSANTTGATVTMKMRNAATEEPVTLAGSVTMDDPAQGLGHYSWNTADTDTEGEYQAEIRVVYSSGKIQRFPQKGWLEVIIEENAG